MIHRIKNSIAASTLMAGLFLSANPEQGVQHVVTDMPYSAVNALNNMCKDFDIVFQKPFEYAGAVYGNGLLPQGQMFRIDDVPHSNSIRLVVDSRCRHQEYFDEAQIAFMMNQACMRYCIINRNDTIAQLPAGMRYMTVQYKVARETRDTYKNKRFYTGIVSAVLSLWA